MLTLIRSDSRFLPDPWSRQSTKEKNSSGTYEVILTGLFVAVTVEFNSEHLGFPFSIQKYNEE
jgi:hypothetical protein